MQCAVWRSSPGKITICATGHTGLWIEAHMRVHAHTRIHTKPETTEVLQPQHTIVLLVNRAGTWSVTVPLGCVVCLKTDVCVFVCMCVSVSVYVHVLFCPDFPDF